MNHLLIIVFSANAYAAAIDGRAPVQTNIKTSAVSPVTVDQARLIQSMVTSLPTGINHTPYAVDRIRELDINDSQQRLLLQPLVNQLKAINDPSLSMDGRLTQALETVHEQLEQRSKKALDRCSMGYLSRDQLHKLNRELLKLELLLPLYAPHNVPAIRTAREGIRSHIRALVELSAAQSIAAAQAAMDAQAELDAARNTDQTLELTPPAPQIAEQSGQIQERPLLLPKGRYLKIAMVALTESKESSQLALVAHLSEGLATNEFDSDEPNEASSRINALKALGRQSPYNSVRFAVIKALNSIPDDSPLQPLITSSELIPTQPDRHDPAALLDMFVEFNAFAEDFRKTRGDLGVPVPAPTNTAPPTQESKLKASLPVSLVTALVGVFITSLIGLATTPLLRS